jgi:hypothetical protein
MYTYLILVTLARIINGWPDNPWSTEQWTVFRAYNSALNKYLDRNS